MVADEESLLSLTHDWTHTALQLGVQTGSIAWRRALQRQLHQHADRVARVPQPSAIDTLQAVQAIQWETITPPPSDSRPLSAVLKSTTTTTEPTQPTIQGWAVTTDPDLPWESLATVYRGMVHQDMDESERRQEYHYWTSTELIDHMQRLENHAAALQHEEQRLRKRARDAGWDWNDRAMKRRVQVMRGWIPPSERETNEPREDDDDDVTDHPGGEEEKVMMYWCPDFSYVMANQRPETAHLVWDDQC